MIEYYQDVSIKKNDSGPEEMAQQLRACIILTDDLSCVPSTLVRQLKTLAPWNLKPSTGL